MFNVTLGARTGRIECPGCRAEHALPPAGVVGLPTNFILCNLVDALNNHEMDHSGISHDQFCESGLDSQPAVARCVECQECLCESCVDVHKRLKKTRGHKIVSLPNTTGSFILEQKRYCSAHEGEELKLYCRTCQEVICRDCAIVTHKQHDYTFIKDVREELTKKMESLSTEVEAISGAFRERAEALEKSISSLNDDGTNVETQVNTFFDRYIQKLQVHRNALLKKVSDKKSVDLKKFDTMKKDVEQTVSNMTGAVTLTKETLSSTSSTDLALMSKHVISRLSRLANMQADSSVIPQPTMWGVHQRKDPLQYEIHTATAAVVTNIDKEFTLGRNVVYIKLEAPCPDPRVKASVSLPLNVPCKDVTITRSDTNSWYISFFIPLPGQVRVSVSVCGVQAQGSPFLLQCSSLLSPGAVVRRGPHWQSSDQDGGASNVGRFIGYQPHTKNCRILVLWDNQTTSYSYRWGDRGAYDIELAHVID